jgi:hypothetical protein
MRLRNAGVVVGTLSDNIVQSPQNFNRTRPAPNSQLPYRLLIEIMINITQPERPIMELGVPGL